MNDREDKKRQLILKDQNFVIKLERLEMLSIKLSDLTGSSVLVLGKSSLYPKGYWMLDVAWENFSAISGDPDEVTYITLKKKVKHWLWSRWQVVMQYQRDYPSVDEQERRYLFEFDESIIFDLDAICVELQMQVDEKYDETVIYMEYLKSISGI